MGFHVKEVRMQKKFSHILLSKLNSLMQLTRREIFERANLICITFQIQFHGYGAVIQIFKYQREMSQ